MKQILVFSIYLLILFGFYNNVFAQDFNLVVCDGPDCTFGSLITLIQRIITALITISTLFAVIAFAYAGFLFLTSGGSEQIKTKAKGVFTKVFIGYLWILGAWLLVYTITSLIAPNTSLLGTP